MAVCIAGALALRPGPRIPDSAAWFLGSRSLTPHVNALSGACAVCHVGLFWRAHWLTMLESFRVMVARENT